MAKTPARKTAATGKRRTTARTPVRTALVQPRPAGEAFAQALSVHAFDLVQVLDATGTIRYVSPAITHLLGYHPQDVVGKDSFSFVHPDDVTRLQDATTEILRRPHAAATREYRIRHHDGTWRSFEGIATNLLEDPVVEGIVLNARDITERLHSDLALRDSEERYRQLVELSPEPLLVHVDEKIAYVNAACVALFGARSAEELLGTPIWDVLHPDSREVIRRRLHQIRTEGRAALLQEITLQRLDGHSVTVEVAGAAIRYHGRPAVQAVIRAVGERPWTDETQRATEENFRELFENANDAIATFTVEGVIQRVNRGAERLLGWNREELIGQSYHKVLTPAAQALADDRTRRYLAGEAMDSRFEIDFVHRDGHIIPVDARTRPMRNREGQVIAFQGIYRDVSERRKADQQLHESRQLLERIADTLPDIVYVVDIGSGRLVYCNRRVTAVLGYARNEMEAKPLEELRQLVHAEDRAQFGAWDAQFAAASDEDAFDREYRVRHLNGEYRWLHVRERVSTRTESGMPGRILGIAEDVTARRRVQEVVVAHQLQRKKIPERLRKFREKLGYTQAEFGKHFGNLKAHQIGSYETGAADPSLELLLALQAQGFPLEHVLGETNTTLLDATLHYLTRAYSHQVIARQLADAVHRVAAQEQALIARVLHELGLEPKPLTTAQRDAVERVTRVVEEDPEAQ